MGPSGSGKTSLLNVLAGHVGKNTKLEMTGSVTVNGQASSSSNHRQAYVQQEDAFYSMLSTAEQAFEILLVNSMSGRVADMACGNTKPEAL
eukprot:349801-Chlamydomonas_euryale.AAC.22